MGLARVAGRVKRPDGRGRAVRVLFLVDTGAVYTVLPERLCRALRLRPTSTAEFGLADGTALVRGVAEARFEIAGRAATSPVVLGEGDQRPEPGGARPDALTARELLDHDRPWPLATQPGRQAMLEAPTTLLRSQLTHRLNPPPAAQ